MASEYLKWKYRDVRPDQPVELTPKEKAQNWWHYHKWYILAGVAALAVLAGIGWQILSNDEPDYQVAYVSSVPLSDEAAAAWEEKIAALAAADGEDGASVRLNQYITTPSGGDVMYGYAAGVTLMGDLESCDSYFFLLEDPETFQAGYEILQTDWLALEDGLYLARRVFQGSKTCRNIENCDRLWVALAKEALS